MEAIGSDALAVVVHPLNQTGPLTLEQLRDLFSGEVADWHRHGQSVGAVLPVMREEGAGTRAYFEVAVMELSLIHISEPTRPY